jgi:hypothetical protein
VVRTGPSGGVRAGRGGEIDRGKLIDGNASGKRREATHKPYIRSGEAATPIPRRVPSPSGRRVGRTRDVLWRRREQRVPVLTYHAHQITGATYETNDLEAFRTDLRTIRRLGLRIVPAL